MALKNLVIGQRIGDKKNCMYRWRVADGVVPKKKKKKRVPSTKNTPQITFEQQFTSRVEGADFHARSSNCASIIREDSADANGSAFLIRVHNLTDRHKLLIYFWGKLEEPDGSTDTTMRTAEIFCSRRHHCLYVDAIYFLSNNSINFEFTNNEFHEIPQPTVKEEDNGKGKS